MISHCPRLVISPPTTSLPKFSSRYVHQKLLSPRDHRSHHTKRRPRSARFRIDCNWQSTIHPPLVYPTWTILNGRSEHRSPHSHSPIPCSCTVTCTTHHMARFAVFFVVLHYCTATLHVSCEFNCCTNTPLSRIKFLSL